MSLKVNSFHANISHPATLQNFQVVIPSLSIANMRIKSCSIPFEKRAWKPIPVMGNTVKIPISKRIPQADTWTCEVYEDDMFTSGLAIETAITLQTQARLLDAVFIYGMASDGSDSPRLLYTLSGAFIESIEPVQLDWEQPAKAVIYKLSFGYSECRGITI